MFDKCQIDKCAIGSVLDFQWLSLCLIAPSKNQTENPFTSDSKTL